jgi:hypothetical protein
MHIQIQSGQLSGGTSGARHLDLSAVQNANTIGTLHLEYHTVRNLSLAKVVNANSIHNLTLSRITVRSLTLTRVTNSNSIHNLSLSLIPWVAVNAELVALLAYWDQTYSTSEKIQMDTLITALKTAGVWTKFDWYGNANWAKSEHDALVNWKNVAQTLSLVGSASWTLNAGLSGVSPATSNSRYKSGWNIGDGAASNTTHFAFFTKITAIAAPQNGMLPMGVWKRVSGGGPSTPDGSFLDLDITSNTGFAGANLKSGDGNTSFAPGTGLGVWGVSRNAGTQITVKDGVTLETDTVSLTADYTDPDGMSVAGSAGLAKRSFPGTEIYWGWGGALTASEFAAIESAFQSSLADPLVGNFRVTVSGDIRVTPEGDYRTYL